MKVVCKSIAQNGIDLSISIIVSFCSNRNRNQPVLLKDIKGSNEWCRVACGRNHTALVTTGGDIYTCGTIGAADQLGYGEGNIIISNKPKPVKSLAEKIDVVEASCGPMLVAIITRTGHLYTWYV